MATRSLNRSVAPRRPASSLGTTGHPIALNDMTELHLDRLVQRLRSKLDCQWGSVRMAFRMTDSDRNGSLSEIEMRQLFDRLDLKVDDTSFDLLLSRIKDSAGDIQYAQFAQLVAPSDTGGVASDIQSGYNDVESWGGDAHGRQRAEGKHDSLLGNTHGTRKEATIPFGDESIQVVSTPRFNRMEQFVDVDNAVTITAPDGATKEFSYAYRSTLWTPGVLRQVVERNGFEVVGVSPLMKPEESATDGDWKIMFTCRRRNT